MTAAPDDLNRLALAHGVATSYLDADDVERVPPASTIRAVLQVMEVPCADAAEVRRSLEAAEEAPWRRLVAPTTVVRAGGDRSVRLVVPAGDEVSARVLPEGGGPPVDLELPRGGDGRERRRVDGIDRMALVVRLPADLPLGVHAIEVSAGPARDRGHLMVVPDSCPVPGADRRWGWQVQLYAMRGHRSWGIGDLADLVTLVSQAGAVHGADFVLLNPLHAATPTTPQEPSPYHPSSRRAWNPLYLRPERCDGWDAARGADRDRLDDLQEEGRAAGGTPVIDRDVVFALKDEALRICAAQPLAPHRQEAFDRHVEEGGAALTGVATAFALSRAHGARIRDWPESLRRPDGEGVAAAAAAVRGEVRYQRWLQWQADVQLADAQQAARGAGMAIGVMTDLAVGVGAEGADGWALADDLAAGVTVGAPPDALAQRGQDWRLPPLRPDRLAETGYRAFRELVGRNLAHAGGLRIDHVMGLFRLFWIPAGAPATDGTYVRYDAEAMLGALALEAHRAGGVVVGEDLGTVEAGVREAMADRGVLGSAVFWFEQPALPADGPAEERPARAAEYRRLALTSVTTHDLPTVAGWAAGEPVRIRAATGQLASGEEEERRRAAEERRGLTDLLVEEGVLDPSERDDVESLMAAVHQFIARTPSLLVSASLADAIGDLRQPNLPGTSEEYPNWRLPLAVPDPTGRPLAWGGVADLLPPSRAVPLEEVLADARVHRVAALLTSARRAAEKRV